jgi:hypothetical protein
VSCVIGVDTIHINVQRFHTGEIPHYSYSVGFRGWTLGAKDSELCWEELQESDLDRPCRSRNCGAMFEVAGFSEEFILLKLADLIISRPENLLFVLVSIYESIATMSYHGRPYYYLRGFLTASNMEVGEHNYQGLLPQILNIENIKQDLIVCEVMDT